MGAAVLITSSGSGIVNVVSTELDVVSPLSFSTTRSHVHRCAAAGKIGTAYGEVVCAIDDHALGRDVVERDVVPSHDDRAVHTHISDHTVVTGDT
jgi:hypothetical protein